MTAVPDRDGPGASPLRTGGRDLDRQPAPSGRGRRRRLRPPAPPGPAGRPAAAPPLAARGHGGAGGPGHPGRAPSTPTAGSAVDVGRPRPGGAGRRPSIDGASHGGLLAFLARVAGRTAAGQAPAHRAGHPRPGAARGRRSRRRRLRGGGRGRAGRGPRRWSTSAAAACPRRRCWCSSTSPAWPAPAAACPLSTEAVIDLVSGALAVLEGRATTGVHCCGPTDWQAVSAAGPTSCRCRPRPGPSATAPARWPPTSTGAAGWRGAPCPRPSPIGTDVERLWRRLADLWGELVAAGADPVQLHTQCLVTPGLRAGRPRREPGRAGPGPGLRAGRPGLRPGLGGRPVARGLSG